MHAQVLSRMQCARVVFYVEKCEKEFVWSDRQKKLAYMKDGNTNKEVRFAGLSLIPASQLIAQVSSLLFAFLSSAFLVL